MCKSCIDKLDNCISCSNTQHFINGDNFGKCVENLKLCGSSLFAILGKDNNGVNQCKSTCPDNFIKDFDNKLCR